MGVTQNEDGEGRWDKDVRSETLEHGARVRPVPKRTPSKVQVVSRDPAILAKNLRNLIRLAGLTEAEAPAEIGVERRWLRRATTSGLARIDKRTRANLERMAYYFDLSGPDELWESDLPRLRRQPAPDKEKILRWRERINWPHAEKLLELLETGEHDFLKGLIDSLYASELLRAGDGAAARSVAAGMQSGQASGLKRRLRPKGPDPVAQGLGVGPGDKGER